VAAVAEEGVASVAVLVDDTAFDGSWLYSAGSGQGNGAGFYFSYSGDAMNTNTTILRSNFTNGFSNTSYGPSGGGCCFQYGATVTKAHQQIESCVFRNNTLVGSFVTGGAVMVFMLGESTEMAFIILMCLFAHNVLRGGEVSAQGAGVYMQFQSGTTVRSVLLLVERSAFESNVASVSGAGGNAGGTGLQMRVLAEATNMTTTIAHCSFSSNTVRAEGEDGVATGAAMNLFWRGATAGGLLTTILDSTFEANRAYGSAESDGGAVFLLMLTTNPYSGAVQTVINGCRFLDNAAVGGGVGWAVLSNTTPSKPAPPSTCWGAPSAAITPAATEPALTPSSSIPTLPPTS
jgi:hypothetical protein